MKKHSVPVSVGDRLTLWKGAAQYTGTLAQITVTPDTKIFTLATDTGGRLEIDYADVTAFRKEVPRGASTRASG